MELRKAGKILTRVILLLTGLQIALCSPPPSEDLHVLSPNGKWEAVAERHYHKDGTFQGYLFRIIDLKNKQLVHDDTKERIPDDDGLAKITSFYWSPDGKYLAQFNYVGRIAQDIFVSYPANGEKGYCFFSSQDLEHIFQKESRYGNFCCDLEEKPWLNKTDLAINVSYRSKDNQSPCPDTARQVIIRFKEGKWTPIMIGKPESLN